MTVQDWMRMLNGFVFFFPSEAALRTLYAPYNSNPGVVLKVRTRSLLRELNEPHT